MWHLVLGRGRLGLLRLFASHHRRVKKGIVPGVQGRPSCAFLRHSNAALTCSVSVRAVLCMPRDSPRFFCPLLQMTGRAGGSCGGQDKGLV